MQRYIAPSLRLAAFNCPNCGYMLNKNRSLQTPLNSPEYHFEGLTFAFCSFCRDYSLWHGATMIFPLGGAAPTPNPDLPNGEKEIYEEARSIVSLSPKTSAALLRL